MTQYNPTSKKISCMDDFFEYLVLFVTGDCVQNPTW